jgi:hypothetical protein
VEEGVAVGFEDVELLNPVVGLQEYVCPAVDVEPMVVL